MFYFSSGSFPRCSKHPNKKHSTRSEMAGLFFCLASAEGAGFFFCPAAIQPHTSVYGGFYAIHAVYTAHATKQHTRIYRGFSDYFPLLFCGCASCYTAPPAPHRNTSQRRSNSSAYRILAATLDAVQVSTSTYYNKVYKGATHRRPCQPGGVCSCCLRITGKC